MKNIQFPSQEADQKIVAVLAVPIKKVALAAVPFVIAAVVGCWLPTPVDFPGVRFLDALITVALGGFAWGVFFLVKPARGFNRKWALAETIIIPIAWLLLVLALLVWFLHLRAPGAYEKILELYSRAIL